MTRIGGRIAGHGRGAGRPGGFTLIELMVVMAIIATLLSIAVPRYMDGVTRSREAALKQTLHTVRDSIDKFAADKGRFPDSLQELVEQRYLKRVPVDPITQAANTWTIVPPPADSLPGQVYDIHSGSPGRSLDGSSFYAEW
ncbi:MAG: prepilin-type N-terminal cleavage/methylation domain-containing protein [Betaproteobacteria bacterium]|nr:prepilin-type N-terminal cleavage/methylation domain-containing protein [Betaproteobacteria bacterium]